MSACVEALLGDAPARLQAIDEGKCLKRTKDMLEAVKKVGQSNWDNLIQGWLMIALPSDDSFCDPMKPIQIHPFVSNPGSFQVLACTFI